MPIRCEMTWQADKKRWRKMYKRKLWHVTCEVLGCESTKEASYLAANAWWIAKRAELDAKTAPPPHPHEKTIKQLERKRDWAKRHGEDGLAENLSAEIKSAKALGEGDEPEPFPTDAVSIAQQFGIIVPADLDPHIAEMIFGDGRIWAERSKREQQESQPVAEDKTIGGRVKVWLAGMLARVHSKTQMSPGQYQNLKRSTEHFRDWVGSERPVEAIDEATLKGYYLFLLKLVADGNLARETAKGRFRQVKQFIGDLYADGMIPLPRNFRSKFVFGASAKKIPTITVGEIRTLVEEAAAFGQLQLHLLLMLNCGYTQSDIAELKDDQVDWKAGRIIRKRSKTAIHEDVPEVNYKLWPRSFTLLKKYRSGGPIVLLTKSDSLWAWEEQDGEEYRSSDSIASQFRHLQSALKAKKQEVKTSLKILRKASATMIESHREYGRYKLHFLGHSPNSVADKHYAAPSETLFDEIVAWLGDQFGLGS